MKRFSLVLFISLLLVTACSSGNQTADPAPPVESPNETVAEAPPVEPTPETSTPAPETAAPQTEPSASAGLNKALADAGLKLSDVQVLLDKTISQGNSELLIVKFIHENEFYFYKYRGDQLIKKVRSSADGLPAQALEGKLISEDEAKQIALTKAGFTADQISDYEIDIEDRDGRIVYQVEFEVGDTDYDYDIDIYTGEIVHESIDD